MLKIVVLNALKIVFKCTENQNLKIQEIVSLLFRKICIHIHINISILQTKNDLIYLKKQIIKLLI